MKELTTEEKAKRYDELFVKASRIYIKENDVLIMHTIEDLFPELKESDDESIRKALINGFNKLDKSAVWYNGITNAQILDWLEKQAEHANFRNKIQIGDKVTRNEDGMLVNLSQLNRVAKVEEKKGEQKPTEEEMKELLRTEYEKGRADALAEIQKSWSEEDEEMFEYALDMIEWYGGKNEDKSRLVSEWLKSIKERIQPQNKWKPSDAQMEAINTAINVIGKGTLNGKQLIELQEQLKKLKGE